MNHLPLANERMLCPFEHKRLHFVTMRCYFPCSFDNYRWSKSKRSKGKINKKQSSIKQPKQQESLTLAIRKDAVLSRAQALLLWYGTSMFLGKLLGKRANTMLNVMTDGTDLKTQISSNLLVGPGSL